MNTDDFRKTLEAAALRLRDAEFDKNVQSRQLVADLLFFDPVSMHRRAVYDLLLTVEARHDAKSAPKVDLSDAVDVLTKLYELHKEHGASFADHL